MTGSASPLAVADFGGAEVTAHYGSDSPVLVAFQPVGNEDLWMNPPTWVYSSSDGGAFYLIQEWRLDQLPDEFRSLLRSAGLGSGTGTGLSDQASRCGGEGNSVQAELDLPAGRDFWQVFPAAGKAPELMEDPNPIHVVVFTSDFVPNLAMGGAAAASSDASTLQDFVCAIHSDGHMDVYSGISREGSPFEPSSATATTGGPSPTPVATLLPSPTPRVIAAGQATWAVLCGDTSDADCDGAVGLFTNNLARSWQDILDESGGRLTVEPRACPTFDGLTARQCWDVSAALASGPFCMVVAHGANDTRYPDYFEIGGQDGTGRLGGPPTGWPMCVGTRSPSPSQASVPAVVTNSASPFAMPSMLDTARVDTASAAAASIERCSLPRYLDSNPWASDLSVVAAYATTAGALAAWQEGGSGVTGAPGPSTSEWRSRAAADVVTLCYYDGTISGPPLPFGVPDYDRILVVIDEQGAMHLYAAGHQSNMLTSAPEGATK